MDMFRAIWHMVPQALRVGTLNNDRLPKPHRDKFGRLGILTQPLRHHVPLSACSSVPVAPVALVAVVFAAFVAGSAPRPQAGQIATASSSSPLQDGGLTGLRESMVNYDHLHSIS